jgi:HSP20 family protein
MSDLVDEAMPRYGDLPRPRRHRFHGGGEPEWLEIPPACDVTEKDDELIVKAELPGMTEDELEITIDDHELVIAGEKKEEDEDEDGGFRHVERSYGFFERAFDLPAGVDIAGVKATIENGILRVVVPRTEEAKTQRSKVPIERK